MNQTRSNETDLVLLRRYRERRDMHAFATVIDRHQGALLRLAHAVLSDGHAAQDAVQEAFLRLCRDADTLLRNTKSRTADQGLGGWLATVVRHQCIDQLRRRRPQVPATALEAQASATDDPTVDADLWTAVAQLPPLERAAVVLRYRDCATYQDIAVALGKTENHVGVILHQALARLRQMPALRAAVAEGVGS